MINYHPNAPIERDAQLILLANSYYYNDDHLFKNSNNNAWEDIHHFAHITEGKRIKGKKREITMVVCAVNTWSGNLAIDYGTRNTISAYTNVAFGKRTLSLSF